MAILAPTKIIMAFFSLGYTSYYKKYTVYFKVLREQEFIYCSHSSSTWVFLLSGEVVNLYTIESFRLMVSLGISIHPAEGRSTAWRNTTPFLKAQSKIENMSSYIIW